jgi:hypothetical protein
MTKVPSHFVLRVIVRPHVAPTLAVVSATARQEVHTATGLGFLCCITLALTEPTLPIYSKTIYCVSANSTQALVVP